MPISKKNHLLTESTGSLNRVMRIAVTVHDWNINRITKNGQEWFFISLSVLEILFVTMSIHVIRNGIGCGWNIKRRLFSMASTFNSFLYAFSLRLTWMLVIPLDLKSKLRWQKELTTWSSLERLLWCCDIWTSHLSETIGVEWTTADNFLETHQYSQKYFC